MVWRDLDLYLRQPELNVAQFFELGARLATLLHPHKRHFRAVPRTSIGRIFGQILT
jgi:hypothetical protein